MLGPSRAFLRYIAQVLPSLGEEAVVQTTIADIAPKAKVRAEEPMDGSPARRATPAWASSFGARLDGRRRPSEQDVSLRVRFARATLSRQRVNDLVASIVARPAPYKAGRLALRARLVSEARTAFRSSGRLGADEAWFEGELTATEEFGPLLDTLWPSVSPTALVRDLLSSREQLERYAAGLFAAEEWQLLLRSRGSTVSVHRLERRRPGAARRGGVPHGRPHPHLRPHRGRRGPGPDADAVPHDRPTRAVGLRHRAR